MAHVSVAFNSTLHETHPLPIPSTDTGSWLYGSVGVMVSEPAFFSLTRPEAPEGLASQVFSYVDQGATAGTPPSGWDTDRLCEAIGSGPDDWARAKDAVDRFVMFDLGWTKLLSHEGIRPGANVAFTAKFLGVWTLNACRIVYVVDEDGPEEAAYGFAYGTLASHAVSGEERFLATFNKATGEVRFEISKFSRPRHPLVRALGPITWAVQRRFSRDCVNRVRAEVSLG